MPLRPLLVAALALVLLAAPAQAAQKRSFNAPPRDIASYPMGQAVRIEPTKVAGVDGDAVRFMYRSESDTGAPRAETGVVITPKGKAPRAGWPVVAWDHGTTGIGPTCAPSQTPNLSG